MATYPNTLHGSILFGLTRFYELVPVIRASDQAPTSKENFIDYKMQLLTQPIFENTVIGTNS